MLQRDKLISILGMLGSNSEGERASAALKVDTLVQASGKSWDDIISPAAYEDRLSLAFELMARGWPPKAACGMAAVLVPGNNIAGWSGGRLGQLNDWANSHGHRDPTDQATQLDYLSHSLNGVYLSMGTKLRAANSVKAASAVFRPYTTAPDGHLEKSP